MFVIIVTAASKLPGAPPFYFQAWGFLTGLVPKTESGSQTLLRSARRFQIPRTEEAEA